MGSSIITRARASRHGQTFFYERTISRSERFGGYFPHSLAPEPLNLSDEVCAYLIGQFDTAWKLASYHLDGLTTAECMWRPASRGLHVHQQAGGRWSADWPDRETYDIGPPSIAWITWHIVFWWSMVIDHSFGSASLSREQVLWPGDADALRAQLAGLHDEWRKTLDQLTKADLQSTARSRWPYTNRPFGDIVAWLNLELTKNAAEIGVVRFLYAVKAR